MTQSSMSSFPHVYDEPNDLTSVKSLANNLFNGQAKSSTPGMMRMTNHPHVAGETGHDHVGVRHAHQSSACLCEFDFFWSYFMAECQKRKERVSSNSSIESRASKTSSPV